MKLRRKRDVNIQGIFYEKEWDIDLFSILYEFRKRKNHERYDKVIILSVQSFK